ncbi:hypothetical protein [Kitasatospora sp. NPDC001095]
MHQLQYVENLPVVACMRHDTSPTAKSVVVCEERYKGPYVVWEVEEWEGRLRVDRGHLGIETYGEALGIAATLARG